MRTMGKIGLVLAGLVVANILTLHWSPLYADLIPSAPAPASSNHEADRSAVRAQLTGMGLSAQDVESRLSQLQSEDLAVLAHNPDHLQMAGVANYVFGLFVIAGIVLAVVIIDSFSQAEEPEAIQPYQ